MLLLIFLTMHSTWCFQFKCESIRMPRYLIQNSRLSCLLFIASMKFWHSNFFWGAWKITKFDFSTLNESLLAHKGICFARLRQIQLQQLLTGRVNCFEVTTGSCRSLYSQRVKRKTCVQKVISYKEQKLSQCTGKQNYIIKNEENSDYYYLSNRKMIQVVFSSPSALSLLAFYFRESFKPTNGSLTEEKDIAGSAKVINLGM